VRRWKNRKEGVTNMPLKNRKNAQPSEKRTKTEFRTVTGPVGNVPNHEAIMRRAYEIHVGRGGLHGHDLDDWLQAERELLENNRPDRDTKNKEY
jgi:hypothetical protein